MNTKIEFCFIQDFPSAIEGISILTGASKNQIKKYLSKKELARAIVAKEPWQLPLNILNHGKINPIYMGPVIKSLFEDQNFLVLSKPAKVHCHPLSYEESDNILSYMQTIAPELLVVNKDKYDRGLFYRLDYETSGLLYYAKTDAAHKQMRENFSQMMKEKKYLAVVEGKASQQSHLVHKLKAYGENNALVKVDEQGVEYHCSYKLLEYNDKEDISLVEVKLSEGFRHQIRVQMQAHGHAIIGDPLYGSKKYKRMMLHCYQYVFEYEQIKYEVVDKNFDLEIFFTYLNC